MSYFIYSDGPREDMGRSKVPYEKWNAPKHWALHFYNVHALSFISANTKDAREKMQAENEIVIGRRKMDFWMRHPNWTKADAHAHLRDTYKLKP